MKLMDYLNDTDRFANGSGARLTEVREGYARAELTVEERHLNAVGVCQGGALFTLADLAFAAVANSRGVATVGVSNSATFLRSARLGDRLIAECSEVMDHHKLPFCEVKVSNDRGELLAVITGLAYRISNKEFKFDSLM